MDKEEKRFWAAAIILGGMAANYHHDLIPSSYWVKGAVDLADYLLQALSKTPMEDPNVSE
jgi:hypothetical protein